MKIGFYKVFFYVIGVGGGDWILGGGGGHGDRISADYIIFWIQSCVKCG